MSEKMLQRLRNEGLNSLYPENKRVQVGLASCGKASGAGDVLDSLQKNLSDTCNIEVRKTGCLGFCSREPLVEVIYPEKGSIIYQNIDERKAKKLSSMLREGKIFQENVLATRAWRDGEETEFQNIPLLDSLPFYKKQKRVVLRNSGKIDPNSLREYIAQGGYQSLAEVLSDFEPEEIIEKIKEAKLRGRGGAGFPTGVKWSFLQGRDDDTKYLICNADEGDPGAYMDRTLLEGDPFSVIEGMTVGSYAMGADKGYIYVRDEYPLAVKRVGNAIERAKEAGLLGEDILDRGFDFNIEIKKGAGAFVCGEETALIASIESKRGNPRPRPPFPAQSGLWGKPTNINNVETWANIPRVIEMGAKEFADIGTEKSGGTKIFSLTGDVSSTGLIEVPFGTSLEEVIFEIGEMNQDKFKAVQTGGPSGGVIPERHIDTPIDYETLDELGSIMGSGGMIVMNTDTCMVDQAEFFVDFCADESCGKCVPCRAGLPLMRDILIKIMKGEGKMENLERLEKLADCIRKTALCGLGETAVNPVMSTLDHFRDEYISHIKDKRCPAGVCENLVGNVQEEKDDS